MYFQLLVHGITSWVHFMLWPEHYALCFYWLVGQRLALEPVHLGNRGKKWVSGFALYKEQRAWISSTAQSLGCSSVGSTSYRIYHRSLCSQFPLEQGLCCWLLLPWHALPPASPAAQLWPQQGTSPGVAPEQLINSCSVSCAIAWQPGCLETHLEDVWFTGIGQSVKLISIPVILLCLSFQKQYCW